LINDEICKLLKDAGCEGIAIGIESGSEEIRKKVLNRKMSDELIIAAFKAAKKTGLKTSSFNMVGIPGETPEDFQKTIELNRKIMPDQMQLTIFYPYPGTRLGDYCFDKGYVKANHHPNYFEETVLNLPTYPPERIKKDSHLFHFEVYKDFDIDRALRPINTEAKKKSFKKRYKDDPNFDWYWAKIKEEEEIERGKRFILEGNIDGAIEAFEEVLKTSPDNIEANYHLGSCYQRKNDWSKTIEKFKEVLLLKTEREYVYHAGAHFHLGEIYQVMGEFRKAKSEFEKCLEDNPNHFAAKNNLAKLVMKNE
jgi:tetratricopeptide (TPR) repeat protein